MFDFKLIIISIILFQMFCCLLNFQIITKPKIYRYIIEKRNRILIDNYQKSTGSETAIIQQLDSTLIPSKT